MSSAEADATAPARRRGERLLSVALLAALVAALMPVTRVVDAGSWLVSSVLIAALILAAGHVARRYRLPAVAVSLIEAAVWVAFMTLVFLRDTALLWVIPTLETVRTTPGLIDDARDTIALGAAPLEADVPLSFLIVGSMGLLAIIVDHVVVTARMPLLASIGIVAVSLIPAIVVPGEVDVVAFVFLAASILFLIRAETRSREKVSEQAAERTAGVPATAIGIGAIAVVVAVVATPLIPPPAMRPGTGVGPGPGIDATLQLGDDLRRPQAVEVLRVRSDAPMVPYLRATTLSRFEGGVWEPDRVRSVPLDGDFGLGALDVDPGIQVNEYTTTVEVLNLASPWLPIPYPAVDVSGLDGGWGAVPYNRTVIAQSGSTQGQTYEVISNVPRPTLEQIRALRAGGPELRDDTTALPAGTPEIISELAAEVTADQTTDYDRLIALQRWFRGGAFTYSLEAPVEEDFDGSGADAVAQFLEQRQGYCIHFASAFALMARTLHMPSRIVVGYLPGTDTTEVVDDQAVFSVSSSLLHAWPEVFFDGVGWIPFEPTTGLGVPTGFTPGASQLGGSDAGGATPRATPLPSASTGPLQEDALDETSGIATGSASTATNLLPVMAVGVGILALLGLPLLLRDVRRRRMIMAARDGDALAAWAIVQDTAIDLAIPVPASESPRAFAQRLVQIHGAPDEPMRVLTDATERASYGPASGGRPGDGKEATDAALRVRDALLSAVPRSRHALALVVPRSLIVRPGTVYAGRVPATR